MKAAAPVTRRQRIDQLQHVLLGAASTQAEAVSGVLGFDGLVTEAFDFPASGFDIRRVGLEPVLINIARSPVLVQLALLLIETRQRCCGWVDLPQQLDQTVSLHARCSRRQTVRISLLVDCAHQGIRVSLEPAIERCIISGGCTGSVHCRSAGVDAGCQAFQVFTGVQRCPGHGQQAGFGLFSGFRQFAFGTGQTRGRRRGLVEALANPFSGPFRLLPCLGKLVEFGTGLGDVAGLDFNPEARNIGHAVILC